MTALLLAAFMLQPLPPPEPVYHPPVPGHFSQYSRQPTIDTVAWRRMVGHIGPERYDGFIALPSCERLGQTVQVQIDGDPRWWTLVIMDCSGHATATEWMARNRILGEIGYFAARDMGLAPGRGASGRMAVQ
jgi:hypothetical protein